MEDTLYDWLSLLKIYKKYVSLDKKVIEIGASNRQRSRQLAKLCQNLTGIEYFKNRIPNNYKNIKYYQGDWQNLNKIKSNKYDILVSSHTIEHVQDDLAAINQTYRILKKNGLALITTPNRNRIIRVIIETFTGKRKFPSGEHVREYSLTDIKTLISQSKFINYKIVPLGLGINSGKYRFYIKTVPKILEKYACFWLIELHTND